MLLVLIDISNLSELCEECVRPLVWTYLREGRVSILGGLLIRLLKSRIKCPSLQQSHLLQFLQTNLDREARSPGHMYWLVVIQQKIRHGRERFLSSVLYL